MNNRMQIILQTLRPLTDAERLAAREVARKNAVKGHGRAPRFEDYERIQVSDFPAYISWVVSILLLVVLFAAANVSVFRVFTAARNHFLETMPGEEGQAQIVGAAMFLLAEFTVVTCIVAQRTLFQNNRTVRISLWIPVSLGVLVAFVGNWTIARPYNLWGLLETVVPPIAVLFMSLILEELFLRSIYHKHKATVAYETALAKWQQETADPEQLPRFNRSYMEALKDAIRQVNLTGRGASERRELIQSMTPEEWVWPVARELRAEEVFNSLGPTNPLEASADSLQLSGNKPSFLPGLPPASQPALKDKEK